jgi:hypothetical protein
MRKKFEIWVRFWRLKTSPWITLAVATYRVTHQDGTEREKEQVRLMTALLRIDTVKVLEFMNDMLF